MKGWIKLHRKIRQNPIFNDPQLFRLMIICLTEATHKDHEQLVGNQIVNLHPGQFVTGRFDLNAMYHSGLSRKEMVSDKTVWRWLKKLESVDFLTIKTTNKFSIISIKNWSLYQNVDQDNVQQMSNKSPTDVQQMSTNKNVKNLENVKNEKNKYHLLQDSRFGEIEQAMIENGLGMSSGIAKEEIDRLIIEGPFDEPVDIIIEAIHESARYNKKSWAYAHRVLVSWEQKNVKTHADALAVIKSWEQEKIDKQNRRTTQPNSKMNTRDAPLPKWMKKEEKEGNNESQMTEEESRKKQKELEEYLSNW